MFRIACPKYLNTLPLVYFLDRSRYEIVSLEPSLLPQLLLEGDVDLSLMPVVAYLKTPGLKILPQLCIGCDGEVETVKLYSRKEHLDLSNAKKIHLDQASLTSQNLVKVLARKLFARDLNDIEFTANQSEADLELIIGDRAFQENKRQDHALDLGQAWQDFTQLPFVFAAWMTAKNLDPQVALDLEAAYQKACLHLEEIAAKQTLLNPDHALEYFKNKIRYRFDERAQKGLELFFKLIKEMEAGDYDTSLKFVA